MAKTRLGLNEIQINDIFEQYNSGISPNIIEKQYKLKDGTVKYLRKKHKIPKYKNPKYTDDYVSLAVNDLISGMLLKDVIAKYDISEPTLKRYMVAQNITYKSDHGRKNHFNKRYFETIDTERKAYWLGFIYADGNIAKTDKGSVQTNRLTINVSHSDRVILEQFLLDTEAHNAKIQDYIPKGTYATNPMSRIYLNSVELCNDLKVHGICENKTGKTSFPLMSVPKELYHHFIRGFFDGDGCIASGPSFYITGDKQMLLVIQQILMKNCGLNKIKLYDYPHKAVEIYNLVYGGRLQCQRIFDYLYKDATIYLHRKYNKFTTLLSQRSGPYLHPAA